MHLSWGMPVEIEKPFRDALDHAAKRRVSELHSMLERLTEEQLAGAVGLCGFVTAYTAIHVVSGRWPTDAGLHRMAEKTVEGGSRDEDVGVTEQNVYLFVSQCALGFKPYAEVFGDIFDDPHEFFAVPFFLTVNVLAAFVPNGQTIWEFLEVIEDAYEKAWLLDLNLLPALMVRARMPQPEQAPDTSTGSR
jgi:hypothetical protein